MFFFFFFDDNPEYDSIAEETKKLVSEIALINKISVDDLLNLNNLAVRFAEGLSRVYLLSSQGNRYKLQDGKIVDIDGSIIDDPFSYLSHYTAPSESCVQKFDSVSFRREIKRLIWFCDGLVTSMLATRMVGTPSLMEARREYLYNAKKCLDILDKVTFKIDEGKTFPKNISSQNYNKETVVEVKETNPKYIFISYSHKDFNAVLPMIKELGQKYNIWYDEGIDPGTEWDENIAKHVEGCDFFIACMTKNYIDSSNCKDELNYARDLDKKRIIVYFENVSLPSGMKMRLNRLQNIHKYTYKTDSDFYLKLSQSDGISACEKPNKNTVNVESSHNIVLKDTGTDDNLFYKALKFAVEAQTVSITMLQRRFLIGYARAGAIIDKMEQLGYVSSSEGVSRRKVLITEDDLAKILEEKSK